MIKSYVRALVLGDEQGASELAQRIFRSRGDLMGVYQDLFYPAMVEIGELWHEGKLNAAQEHRATETTLAQMARLRAAYPVPPMNGRRAVVGAVEGERHFVGSLMVADAFRFDGWKVDFLGADVPTRDFSSASSWSKADVLALSITMEANVPRLGILARALRRRKRAPKVVVGGRALNAQPDLARALGCEYAGDPQAAVRAARRLVGLKDDTAATNFDALLRQVGARIRGARQEKSLTQQQLAQRAGLDRTFIVAVELGKQNVSLGALAKVAGALGFSLDRLLLP